MLLLCTYDICNYISYQVENCENNSKNCENNSKNCEINSKNCENNIIFTPNYEVIRQKTQNNTFYLTGITPSRGN